MIKILYICDTLKYRSGISSLIRNYIKYLNKEKFQIDMMIYSDSELKIVEELKNEGVNIIYMPKLKLGKIINFIIFLKEFFRKNSRYKIIHSHFTQIDSLVFFIAKIYGVKKFISHSHNTKYSEYKLRAIRNYFLCFFIKKQATIWGACSKKAGEFLYGRNFSVSPRSLIINNGIESHKFLFNLLIRKKVRRNLKIENEILLGTVGSCKPQKNQMFLIEILKILKEEYKDKKKYKLLIIGDGELKLNLQKKIKQLGLEEECILLGERKDVNELMQAIDIFLLPSLYEGLPVVGIEAQAMGIPCYFSDTITREAAICNVEYLSIKDPKIWVKKILTDKRVRIENATYYIKEKGYEIIEEVKKLEKVYEEL